MHKIADLQSCRCASAHSIQLGLCMDLRLYKVGQRVDKWCVVCSEERGHVVALVSAKGRATRVTCPICGTRGTFKNGAISPAKSASSKEARPYDSTHTYRVKQLINHSTYGLGEVVTLIEPKKMDVLFADRISRMIHSRV
jgi:hypothetical protein